MGWILLFFPPFHPFLAFYPPPLLPLGPKGETRKGWKGENFIILPRPFPLALVTDERRLWLSVLSTDSSVSSPLAPGSDCSAQAAIFIILPRLFPLALVTDERRLWLSVISTDSSVSFPLAPGSDSSAPAAISLSLVITKHLQMNINISIRKKNSFIKCKTYLNYWNIQFWLQGPRRLPCDPPKGVPVPDIRNFEIYS